MTVLDREPTTDNPDNNRPIQPEIRKKRWLETTTGKISAAAGVATLGVGAVLGVNHFTGSPEVPTEKPPAAGGEVIPGEGNGDVDPNTIEGAGGKLESNRVLTNEIKDLIAADDLAGAEALVAIRPVENMKELDTEAVIRADGILTVVTPVLANLWLDKDGKVPVDRIKQLKAERPAGIAPNEYAANEINEGLREVRTQLLASALGNERSDVLPRLLQGIERSTAAGVTVVSGLVIEERDPAALAAVYQGLAAYTNNVEITGEFGENGIYDGSIVSLNVKGDMTNQSREMVKAWLESSDPASSDVFGLIANGTSIDTNGFAKPFGVDQEWSLVYAPNPDPDRSQIYFRIKE